MHLHNLTTLRDDCPHSGDPDPKMVPSVTLKATS